VTTDVLVIGAGIAGLACAGELARAGREVVVLNSGRSVGGRCSTWRADDGRLFDYGLTFFHGESTEFLSAFAKVDATRIDGWPHRIEGSGTPCQPHAFTYRSKRFAYAEGVSVFPKHLARGLDVRVSSRVERISRRDRRLFVEYRPVSGTSGDAEAVEAVEARTVVLAVPNSRAAELLEPLETSDEVRAMRRLLASMSMIPSLTLSCAFPEGSVEPSWDVMLPDSTSVIGLISNEGTKRPGSPGGTFVIQAGPAWSSAHIDDPPPVWSTELLHTADDLIGFQGAAPVWSRPHRWRHARTDLGTQFKSPVLMSFEGCELGIAGESFSREGGAESAFISGVALARRIAGVKR
jgi:renalase